MKLKLVQSADTGHEMICDEYLASEFNALDDVFKAIEEFDTKHPNHLGLATLDDLGQAQYTSMHATMSNNLDDTENHDLSSVDSSAFEGEEHIGYLSTKSEFFIREKNFLVKADPITFSDVCQEGLTIDDDEISTLEKIHTVPLDYIDSEILIKIVPVKSSALTLSAFPNGYFSCDLGPFDNYALAKHLDEKFGYKLFGIGASLIGFKRANNLDGGSSYELGIDIAALYNRNSEKLVVERFSNIAQKYNFLFLKYVEYLE